MKKYYSLYNGHVIPSDVNIAINTLTLLYCIEWHACCLVSYCVD